MPKFRLQFRLSTLTATVFCAGIVLGLNFDRTGSNWRFVGWPVAARVARQRPPLVGKGLFHYEDLGHLSTVNGGVEPDQVWIGSAVGIDIIVLIGAAFIAAALSEFIQARRGGRAEQAK